jgi:hypothetical protein
MTPGLAALRTARSEEHGNDGEREQLPPAAATKATKRG